jgi:hypothetical protein
MAAPAALEAAALAVASALEARVDQRLAALDNLGEEDMASLRARRLADLKRDAAQRREWAAAGHGVVATVRGDKDFFEAARGVQRVVALFWRASRPCDAMKGLLRSLAPQHLETKFIEVGGEGREMEGRVDES